MRKELTMNLCLHITKKFVYNLQKCETLKGEIDIKRFTFTKVDAGVGGFSLQNRRRERKGQRDMKTGR
jgi:hypothetical protein